MTARNFFVMAFWLWMAAGMVSAAGAVEIQGHRGARGHLPENTLPAFRRALEIGVDVLELDIVVTRDGVVMVAHDPCLNSALARIDGKWVTAMERRCIVDMTAEEVQRIDVGRIDPAHEYARRFPQQMPIDGTRMPRLADVFALTEASGARHVRFNIETKLSPMARSESPPPRALVEYVLKVVRAHGMAGRVTIQSFDWRTLKIVQERAPEIPTVYLSAQQKFLDNIGAGNREGSAWTAGLNARDFGDSVPRMVRAAGGAVWSPYHGDVTDAKVKEAHALGIKVVPWTVNEPRDIERMLDCGVDGIIGDYPDRLREALATRRRSLPVSIVVK